MPGEVQAWNEQVAVGHGKAHTGQVTGDVRERVSGKSA